MYNFGYASANESGEGDEVIDWCGEFDRDTKPRKIPNSVIWNEKLWPRLAEAKRKFSRATVIRLDGMASLSAGFAFGQTFLQVGRCCLEVSQNSRESGLEWSRSDEKVPAGKPEPKFVSRIMPGNNQATAGVIIINALPSQDSSKLVADVGEYLGEAEVFKAFGAGNESSQVDYNLLAIRQLLIEGFDTGELRELCYDNPVFRPVYDRLADLTGKKDIVQQLLEFVER